MRPQQNNGIRDGGVEMGERGEGGGYGLGLGFGCGLWFGWRSEFSARVRVLGKGYGDVCGCCDEDRGEVISMGLCGACGGCNIPSPP